jgi:hypothetical protein
MKKMTRMLAVGCVMAVGVGCGGEMEAVGVESGLGAVEQAATWTGTYGGKTYRFNTTPMSWPQARSWCQSVAGFDLVILNGSAEELWVRGQINAGYHLGMTDTSVEGTWRWNNGALVSSGYTNWLPGSPNQNGEEDCGYSDPYWGWQWDDQTCSTSTPFPKAIVCEN